MHAAAAIVTISRVRWVDFRKWLPPDHELRRNSVTFGKEEHGQPPPVRTHAGMLSDAFRNQEHLKRYRQAHPGDPKAYKKDLPYKTTGVKEVCPLAALHLFNLVWDLLPDMMHIVPAVMKGHVVPMMQGKRDPKKPKDRKETEFWSKADQKDLLARWEAVKRKLLEWRLSKVSLAIC